MEPQNDSNSNSKKQLECIICLQYPDDPVVGCDDGIVHHEAIDATDERD